MIVSTLERL